MRAVLPRLPVRLVSKIGLATGTMGEQENGLIREPLAPRIHRANKRLYLWAREDGEYFLFFFPFFVSPTNRRFELAPRALQCRLLYCARQHTIP